MARTLKVFRTAIGFHDAYVAAPSRAAALRAWGASRDLFARGVAEEVTDPALTAEPLAHPGAVIRRSRGTAAEQIAALPETPRAERRAARGEEDAPVRRRGANKRAGRPDRAEARLPRPKPKPKPSRGALDAAEEAVAAAAARFAGARRAIEARQAALDQERRALAAEEEREAARLETARAAAERNFSAAMRAWRAE